MPFKSEGQPFLFNSTTPQKPISASRRKALLWRLGRVSLSPLSNPGKTNNYPQATLEHLSMP